MPKERAAYSLSQEGGNGIADLRILLRTRANKGGGGIEALKQGRLSDGQPPSAWNLPSPRAAACHQMRVVTGNNAIAVKKVGLVPPGGSKDRPARPSGIQRSAATIEKVAVIWAGAQVGPLGIGDDGRVRHAKHVVHPDDLTDRLPRAICAGSVGRGREGKAGFPRRADHQTSSTLRNAVVGCIKDTMLRVIAKGPQSLQEVREVASALRPGEPRNVLQQHNSRTQSVDHSEHCWQAVAGVVRAPPEASGREGLTGGATRDHIDFVLELTEVCCVDVLLEDRGGGMKRPIRRCSRGIALDGRDNLKASLKQAQRQASCASK
ncbi:MAG: hypothetical protein QOE75_2766 [Solirubrobacterales bacterium]|jgi:hypothetical protein|nr:hypothetical protein [Solirubrobacterales bacterium]